jgi:hypothetical protein
MIQLDERDGRDETTVVERFPTTGNVHPFSPNRILRSRHQYLRTFIAKPGKLGLVV